MGNTGQRSNSDPGIEPASRPVNSLCSSAKRRDSNLVPLGPSRPNVPAPATLYSAHWAKSMALGPVKQANPDESRRSMVESGTARGRTGRLTGGLTVAIVALLILGPWGGYLATGAKEAELVQVSPYFARGTMSVDGKTLGKVIISGPPEPPAECARSVTDLPEPPQAAGINVLVDVPAFSWSYGSAPTSAAMIAGYYDRGAFPDMYMGPTNGGVMPLDNSSWLDWYDGTDWQHQCPLSATHNGLDGRITNGHVDDYWVHRDDPGPDPFSGNWAEHAWGDCTADFMKSNQAVYGNVDGGTAFYFNPSGAKYVGTDAGDGGYGLELFYESRGYAVADRYNRVLLGYDWDGEGTTYSPAVQGATFGDYEAEIDAGRPVMVHFGGHTVVGVGYDDSTNTIYIHDTWDYNTHAVSWGGEYGGMPQLGITVVTLAGPGFEVDRHSLSVLEGDTNSFRVKLPAQPSSAVTASVSVVSGDSDIAVAAGSALSFTTSNWNEYQTVTLAAAQDAGATGDSATVRIRQTSGDSIPDTDVTAKEIDDDGAQVLLFDEPFDTISTDDWVYVDPPNHRASHISGRLFVSAGNDWTQGCGVVTRDAFPNGMTVQFDVQLTYIHMDDRWIAHMRDGELNEPYHQPSGSNYVALYASFDGNYYVKTSTGQSESIGPRSGTGMDRIAFEFTPTQTLVTYGGVTKAFPLVLDAYHIWFGGHRYDAYYDNLQVTQGFGLGSAAVFRVDLPGRVFADQGFYGSAFITGSADLAEWVPLSGAAQAGTVLELDPSQPGRYRPSQGSCSALLAGVVSSQPGMVLGGTEYTEGKALLALAGIVPVKVTNEGGPILLGDLLVSSSTPGHAMRWAGPEPCPCALVGKALEPMTGERGVISVLLTAH